MSTGADSTENAFVAELVLKPVPSRLLLIFIVFTHLLVSVVLFSVLFSLPDTAFWLMGLLLIAVSGSLLYNLLLQGGRLPDRWAETIYWRESGGWELITATGEHLPVIFCGSSFSSVFIDVLNFKTRRALGNRRFTVILLPDNSDASQRRYLRMRLLLVRAAA